MERSSVDDVDPVTKGMSSCHASNIRPSAIKSTWQSQFRFVPGPGGSISPDALKAVVDKVGNSIAAVTKEVELQRTTRKASAAPVQSPPADGGLPTLV